MDGILVDVQRIGLVMVRSSMKIRANFSSPRLPPFLIGKHRGLVPQASEFLARQSDRALESCLTVGTLAIDRGTFHTFCITEHLTTILENFPFYSSHIHFR
jgi:hypothetical protein